MADLKSGKSSTEWWTVVGVIALAAAKMLGIVPEDASVETVATDGVEAMPYAFDKIMELIKGNSTLLIAAGIAWAYLKRRYGLKARQINVEKTNESRSLPK